MEEQNRQVQAVLFGLQGVILADSRLERQVTGEVLQNWGIVLKPGEYRDIFLERTESEGFFELLVRRGRAVNREIVSELVQRKQALYGERLNREIPLVPGLGRCLQEIQLRGLPLGLVCSQKRADVTQILAQCNLQSYWQTLITDTDEAVGYPLALADLQKKAPGLQPGACLVIASTYRVIKLAQTLNMQSLGLPTLFPVHMLQRRADWVVDRYDQIDWDYILYPRRIPAKN